LIPGTPFYDKRRGYYYDGQATFRPKTRSNYEWLSNLSSSTEEDEEFADNLNTEAPQITKMNPVV